MMKPVERLKATIPATWQSGHLLCGHAQGGEARHPQTNGIRERFHKTILHEFYQVAFRRKLYPSVEELQSDLDILLKHYNTERTHQGKICRGRTPIQTLLDGKKFWNKKVGQLN